MTKHTKPALENFHEKMQKFCENKFCERKRKRYGIFPKIQFFFQRKKCKKIRNFWQHKIFHLAGIPTQFKNGSI